MGVCTWIIHHLKFRRPNTWSAGLVLIITKKSHQKQYCKTARKQEAWVQCTHHHQCLHHHQSRAYKISTLSNLSRHMCILYFCPNSISTYISSKAIFYLFWMKYLSESTNLICLSNYCSITNVAKFSINGTL